MDISAPDRTEAADFYFTYIDKVAGEDVLAVLERQLEDVRSLRASITEERSLHSYAPGKWSAREVLSHMNDTERVFSFRAFWFARALEGELPSMDQDAGAKTARGNERSWASHGEEFRALRESSLALFQSLPADAWIRSGIASGSRVTVRALAYICAGHVAHHVGVLLDRYR